MMSSKNELSRLPLRPAYLPMEAASADEIPVGHGWQYEPRWDGFRCLAFRDGSAVKLQSTAVCNEVEG